jgi:hypothetical protein
MSRPPHIIGATHVIAAPVGIIRPIANLNRDAAGIAIARIAVTRTVTRVTGVIAGSVPWISAIIVVSASACPNP